MRLLPVIALALLVAPPLSAQQGSLRAPLSTRATFSMPLSAPRVEGQPAAPALNVVIDYGQPHVRGRDVPVELAADGTVWRTGANVATTLRTEADLMIGGAAVPKGAYSLYTVRENGRYILIINSNTGQWGTEYDATKDFVRVPLRHRALSEVQESLQIAMVPVDAQSARGVLTIRWGTLELAADWSAK